LDCGGISSDKLYDACIWVVAIYNISESTCNETITKDGKAVCLLYVCQAYPEESKQLACFQRISGM
jgi:hypothetical protein